MNTYLPDTAYAKQELARLHGIRAQLARNIVECKTLYATYPGAKTYISLYQTRLKENVLPAIKECNDYLAKHA